MSKFAEEQEFLKSNAAPYQDRMAEKLNLFIGVGSNLEQFVTDILVEACDYCERNYQAFNGLSRKGYELEVALNKKSDELYRMDKVLDVVLAVAKRGNDY